MDKHTKFDRPGIPLMGKEDFLMLMFFDFYYRLKTGRISRSLLNQLLWIIEPNQMGI